MSTVLRAGNRRCDAVCHNALGEKCGCICQSKFHGSSVLPSKAEAAAEVKKILRDRAVKQVEESFERASQQPEFNFYAPQE